LLTTYDLFNLYFNIENGLVTKDDARGALYEYGVVSFSPSHSVQHIVDGIEIYHSGTVVVLNLTGRKIEIGARVILDHAGRYSLSEVLDLQVNDSSVAEAASGEVGIKLSEPLKKGGSIWLLEEELQKKSGTHPRIGASAE